MKGVSMIASGGRRLVCAVTTVTAVQSAYSMLRSGTNGNRWMWLLCGTKAYDWSRWFWQTEDVNPPPFGSVCYFCRGRRGTVATKRWKVETEVRAVIKRVQWRSHFVQCFEAGFCSMFYGAVVFSDDTGSNSVVLKLIYICVEGLRNTMKDLGQCIQCCGRGSNRASRECIRVKKPYCCTNSLGLIETEVYLSYSVFIWRRLKLLKQGVSANDKIVIGEAANWGSRRHIWGYVSCVC
jgi:hypothetical protein